MQIKIYQLNFILYIEEAKVDLTHHISVGQQFRNNKIQPRGRQVLESRNRRDIFKRFAM